MMRGAMGGTMVDDMGEMMGGGGQGAMGVAIGGGNEANGGNGNVPSHEDSGSRSPNEDDKN
jgi:hypothetical protein